MKHTIINQIVLFWMFHSSSVPADVDVVAGCGLPNFDTLKHIAAKDLTLLYFLKD